MRHCRSFLTLALGLSVSITNVGCQSSRAHERAQRLARETLVNVLDYEQTMKKKAAAIERYFAGSTADLQDDFAALMGVGTNSERNRLAGDAIDDLIDEGFRDSRFREMLERMLEFETDAKKSVETRVARLQQRLAQYRRRIQLQARALATLKGKLEKLQADRSTKEALNDLQPFIEYAKKVYTDLKDRAE